MTLLEYNQYIHTDMEETDDGIPYFVTNCKYFKNEELKYEIKLYHNKRYLFPIKLDSLFKIRDIIKGTLYSINDDIEELKLNIESNKYTIITEYTREYKHLKILIEGYIDDCVYKSEIQCTKSSNFESIMQELYYIFKELSQRGYV